LKPLEIAMKPKTLAALTAAVAALSASTALAQTTPAPTTLSLSAEAAVNAVPDVADIGAGVMTQAPEASAALAANAERMTKVVAALRKAGVAERDIQTSGLSLQPQYRYEQNQPPALVGYQANNRVSVTLRDLRQAGRIIDTLVAEGANQIDGPTFRIDKPEPLMDKARADAVRIGKARAELYAQAAGLRVKRIASMSELGDPRPSPMPVARLMAMEAKADSPVEPGEVKLSVTLTMVFELE
jgi:uncharacterized protein